MNNKERINKSLSKICVSESLDKRILNQTVYKSNMKKNSNLSSRKAVAMTFIIFFLAITTVFAQEIIYKYILNKKWVDNQYEQTITITEPVNINKVKNYTCDNVKTLNELENSLGIKFVFDTSKYNGQIDKCEIKVNDSGNIEKVNVSVTDFYDFSNDNKEVDSEYKEDFTQEEYLTWKSKRKSIDVYISFMTQYASSETIAEFKNLGKVTGSEEVDNKEFFAENINTEGFYMVFPSENIPLQKDAMFVNNNILYTFSANKPVSIDELLNIINGF